MTSVCVKAASYCPNFAKFSAQAGAASIPHIFSSDPPLNSLKSGFNLIILEFDLRRNSYAGSKSGLFDGQRESNDSDPIDP